VGAKRREAVFDKNFLEDLRYWIRTDRKTAQRVLEIVLDVMRDPFAGLGKPEPLKFLAPNLWSRRVNLEHRVVYMVGDGRVDFLQARYHY
jgi:toxin YoeB